MEWLTHGLAAFSGCVMTVVGAWFWIRSKASSVDKQVATDQYQIGKLYRDEARIDAISVAKEYKEELDCVKKEMEELHERHLECQRQGMLRDIQISKLKEQVESLSKQVELLKTSVTKGSL